MATQAEELMNDLSYIRFPRGIPQRSAIALVNLLGLVLFVAVEIGFSYFSFPTPRTMIFVAVAAFLFRAGELVLAQRCPLSSFNSIRSSAVVSICTGLLIPFALAAATRQMHTHYFGLLILPVLEAALYFSLPITLLVATISSCSAFLWVAYAAHFRPPFQLGELLEAATLILLLFTVGTLVWLLLDLLGEQDRELRRRLSELEATRERLVEGEKLAAIGRLASAVAHEIRNPVAIISSAIEAAGSMDLTVDEREDMLKVAFAEARRLARLTSDFLSYAHPGDLPRTEIDVHTLLGYIASITKAHALGKNVPIRLKIEGDCLTLGNEDQLQQALLNLMKNAIDASPEGEEILVGCTHAREQIRITVENGGPPIPTYAVPRIFEPFFTAKRGGTGLGLSIARKIAETHGGALSLQSNSQGHIEFALLLPSICIHH